MLEQSIIQQIESDISVNSKRETIQWGYLSTLSNKSKTHLFTLTPIKIYLATSSITDQYDWMLSP